MANVIRFPVERTRAFREKLTGYGPPASPEEIAAAIDILDQMVERAEQLGWLEVHEIIMEGDDHGEAS